MTLNDFAGNDTVKYELSKAMREDCFPHALIIDGAKGTGKKTLAEIIARYCVCLSEKGNKPCGKCAGCLKAMHRSHPDIFINDGTKPGALSIENIRSIRTDAFIKPNEAPKKAYLLLDSDKMLPPAQNALLKILEEPPANVVFVITVSSANTLLQTVRSRSRIYTLYPPEPEEAVSCLSMLFPDKAHDDMLSAVKSSGCNIGEAAALLEGGSEEEAGLAEAIIKAVINRQSYELLLLTGKLSSGRDYAAKVLELLSELAGECLRAGAGFKNTSDIAQEAAQKLSLERIYVLSDNIMNARDILKSNVNLSFFGTWLCSVLLSR